jgi:hypothetical protein
MKARTAVSVLVGVAAGLAIWFTFLKRNPVSGLAPALLEDFRTQTVPAARRTGPSPVPKLSLQTRNDLVTDPKARLYDPVKIAEVEGKSLRSLFDAEPRDPGWASRKEADLRQLIEKDLIGSGLDARLTNLECHTATCVFTLQSEKRDDARRAALLVQYAPPANRLEPDRYENAKGQSTRTIALGWSAEDRDIAGWNRDFPAIRKELLARRRAQYQKAYAVEANRPQLADMPPIPEE